MPRGDPVDGVGVVRNLDAATRQLIAKSYRPRSGCQRAVAGSSATRSASSAGETTNGSQSRSPPARRARRRPRRGARRAPRGRRAPLAASAMPAAERVERADAAHRQAGARAPSARAVAIPIRRPVKEPGPTPTAIRSTALPAAGGLGRPLDLGEQRGRVPRAAVGREAEQRLVRGPRRRASRRRRCPRSPCRSRRPPARAAASQSDVEDEESRPVCPRRTRSPGACRGCSR